MSASQLLQELLSGSSGATESPGSDPTAANAAKAANLRMAGSAKAGCERLRKFANSAAPVSAKTAVSRGFAGIRNVDPQAPTGLRASDSQDSQGSQGWHPPSTFPDRLDTSAAAWTDPDIASFLDRRARLLRWGWPESDAEGLAERLVIRDREYDDDRVSCTDCGHYRPGRCGNHGPAGLNVPDVGRDWAGRLQRCHGFSPGRSDKTCGSTGPTAATDTAAAEASAGGGDA